MNLFPQRRVSTARCVLLACALALPALALAQALPPTPEPPPDASAANATSQPRFDIELQSEPEEMRNFLLRHMALQRFRDLPDLDSDELARLVRQVPDDLGELLGTLGHFNPVIQVTTAPSASSTAPLGRVLIQVEPGPLTRVESVLIAFKGDIADQSATAEQREAAQKAFTLKAGDRFTQADWESAKGAALRALTAFRYPTARIDGSLADVDPNTQTVRLAVEFDSGSPVRIGEVRVSGNERYESAAAENLVRLSGLVEGSDYDLAKLQEAQRRIAASGYYDSVFVTVEPSPDQQVAPVLVQVRESLRQKVVFGIGGSTDSGPRLSIEHTHHRLPGIDWRAVSRVLVEREDQQLSTDWSSPVNPKGWRWIAGAQAARQLDGFDTTTSQRLRLGQSQEDPQRDRSFFVQFDRAVSVNSLNRALGSGIAETAITGNYVWTRRQLDNLIYPDSGHALSLELGAGTTLSPIRRPFTRTRARWMYLWPIPGSAAEGGVNAPTPLGESQQTTGTTSAGRIALRMEGGAVVAQKDAPVPETQLFLTGGDNSVRGYGLRDIGIPQSDGGVAPGRYLAVASVEWQRPIRSRGLRTPWESVVFMDGGAVADQVGELRARYSVGVGVRYKSPVGPLQLDVAYGLDPKQLRLHLNVGFSF